MRVRGVADPEQPTGKAEGGDRGERGGVVGKGSEASRAEVRAAEVRRGETAIAAAEAEATQAEAGGERGVAKEEKSTPEGPERRGKEGGSKLASHGARNMLNRAQLIGAFDIAVAEALDKGALLIGSIEAERPSKGRVPFDFGLGLGSDGADRSENLAANTNVTIISTNNQFLVVLDGELGAKLLGQFDRECAHRIL